MEDFEMAKEDLIDFAKTLEDAIIEAKLSKSETMMVLGLLQGRLYARVIESNVKNAIRATSPVVSAHVTSPVPSPVEAAPAPRPAFKPAPKKIQYDPAYDPEPPFDVQPLPPPQAATPGKVLVPSGKACICSACERIVYTTTRDVKDGMKVEEFVTSFKPYAEGTPALPYKIELQNIEGNVSVDCPACGGVKTLYLIGRKKSE